MGKKDYSSQVAKTLELFEKASIILTEKEKTQIEIADFGLDNIDEIGLEIMTYINTNRVCAKELAMFPNQTCPQHKHVDGDYGEGKEETFRVRYGTVYLYVEGDGKKEDIAAKMPPTDVDIFHEIILNEGEQYTLYPNTWHWFQSGEKGAIVSEFSTMSSDETDVFFDKKVVRLPE